MKVVLDPLGKSGDVEERITLVTDDAEPVVHCSVKAFVHEDTSRVHGERFQQRIFSERCDRCHGGPAARDLQGRPLYEAVCEMCHRNADSVSGTDRAAVRTWIEAGRPERGMPAYATRSGGPLSERQVESLMEILTDDR